jgi:hypothetical protein
MPELLLVMNYKIVVVASYLSSLPGESEEYKRTRNSVTRTDIRVRDLLEYAEW